MPRIPNSRQAYSALNKRVERYLLAITGIYRLMEREAAKAVLLTNFDGSRPFRFNDYPETRRAIKKMQAEFARGLNANIVNGINEEWLNANLFSDKLTRTALNRYGAISTSEQFRRYFNNNDEARKAFLKRKMNGMTISDRVWNISNDHRQNLEAAISTAIEGGTDAITLSKQISRYLQDFDKLRADYTEKFGTATNINDCEYRSARLARTEINMAYRTAESERWQQLDFVVGFEVKRSSVPYDCPLCDELKGKFPKDFVFAGWHPNCRCYQIPIMKTEKEFWAYDGRGEETTESVNEIKDVSDRFKQWVAENSERIEVAEKNGSLPFFLQENKTFMDDALLNNLTWQQKIDMQPKVASASVKRLLLGKTIELPDTGSRTTGELRLNFKGLKDYLAASHSPSSESKWILHEMYRNPQRIRYDRFYPLDMSRPNIDRKIKDGFTGFNHYLFRHNGETWRVGMAVINDKYERPYFITKA